MSKVIFLGSIYPQQLLDELTRRKQFADYPAHIFQKSLLKGLCKYYHNLYVVTSPVIRSSYASVADVCKKRLFSHTESSDEKDIYVGTTPYKGVQLIFEFWKVLVTLWKQMRHQTQKGTLIIYALHSPFLLPAVLLRNKFKCTCVVVPDLPEFMSKSHNIIRILAKRLDKALINFCLKRLDCYVLFSQHMTNKLPIKNKPWIQIEGIWGSLTEVTAEKVKEKVILYCGNISKRYGILELLEAFHQIPNNNYRLWICGRGDGEIEVARMSEIDDRIQYFGVISHDEVLLLQRKATVLINPRSSEGEYTKYSFPSKTMEYMASGTPTIMSHLPAIPEEYDEYLYYIDEENVEGIKKIICKVCELSQDELNKFGKRASDFIRLNKNTFVQSEKIVRMINNVSNR